MALLLDGSGARPAVAAERYRRRHLHRSARRAGLAGRRPGARGAGQRRRRSVALSPAARSTSRCSTSRPPTGVATCTSSTARCSARAARSRARRSATAAASSPTSACIVDEGYDEIFLPAEMVDAVVYYPDTEQTAGVVPPRALAGADHRERRADRRRRSARVQLRQLAGRRDRAAHGGRRGGRPAGRQRRCSPTFRKRRLREHRRRACRKRWRAVIFEAGRLADVTLRGRERRARRPARARHVLRRGAASASASCPRRRCSRSATSSSTRPASARCRSTARATSTSPNAATGARNYVGPGGFIDLTDRGRDDRLRLRLDGARRRARRWTTQAAHRQARDAEVRRSRRRGHVLRAARPGRRQARLLRHPRRTVPAHPARHGAGRRDARHRRAARHRSTATPMQIVLPEAGRVPAASRALVGPALN